MTKITIDSGRVAKLKDVREMVELRDEAGRIVGHFLPGPPRDENGQIICPYSEEEIELLGQQTGGRSLNDIFADLDRR